MPNCIPEWIILAEKPRESSKVKFKMVSWLKHTTRGMGIRGSKCHTGVETGECSNEWTQEK